MEGKIIISENGPYLVSGNIPISEEVIVLSGHGSAWKAGREIQQNESYSLCRCGKTKTPPFCDGSHEHVNFNGTEKASRTNYLDRVSLMEGPGIDLLDDERCAFARFCHRESGSVWDLVQDSSDPKSREEAIKAANNCPSGRLTAVDKSGNLLEPDYEPSISIIQDQDQFCSGGIFVKGYIPVESWDGHKYEVRNRMVLCRCGHSRNKPFCDASHVSYKFIDSASSQKLLQE